MRSAPRPATKRTDPGTTRALAAHCAGIELRRLPRSVKERAKDLVLDHIGVALLGATFPWSMQVRDVALADRARAESTIYGARRTSPRNAALANGAAAHAIEFDDTHDESLQHPGCVVIPAAMAMGESLDCDGGDFLTAMIAGYEAQCRVGLALGAELMRRGFHATATCGVYGAATAATRLLRRSSDVLASAYGIAASMSAGVMQFSQDPQGSTIKRLFSGLPAERGVLAALLAAEGFAGPAGALEGRYGFARVYTQIEDLGRITRDPDGELQIERITVKLYPCCKQFHALIEAIEECRAVRPFDARDVTRIHPLGTHAMIDTHMEYRPQSSMAAQYSLPYTTAVAIAGDPSDCASFDAPALHRRSLLAIADRVEPEWNAELEKHFPSRYPAGVRIVLRDGTSLTATVLDARSSPERPITRDDVVGKFVRVTAPLMNARRQERIIDACLSLDRGRTVRDVTALLRHKA